MWLRGKPRITRNATPACVRLELQRCETMHGRPTAGSSYALVAACASNVFVARIPIACHPHPGTSEGWVCGARKLSRKRVQMWITRHRYKRITSGSCGKWSGEGRCKCLYRGHLRSANRHACDCKIAKHPTVCPRFAIEIVSTSRAENGENI